VTHAIGKPKTRLRNIVFIDEKRLDALLAQVPNALGIIENLMNKFEFSFKGASLGFEMSGLTNISKTRKIRRLESYLDRNGLINKVRPRRMPHRLRDEPSYWWVKETFSARKVIIPTPILLKGFGVAALTVWISDPKPAPKPKHEYDWTGSFLYLPTIHFDGGKLDNVVTGCSALQFISNVANNLSLFNRDGREPLARISHTT
jgi:hypothetical protein